MDLLDWNVCKSVLIQGTLLSISGLSNSFNAVGQIYIPGFLYGPGSVEKKFKQARLYISGPQTFLCASTGNQLIKLPGTPVVQIYSY